MSMRSWPLFLIMAVLLVVVGCGDTSESDAVECGPNSSPVGFQGAESGCECDDGFEMSGGTCVAVQNGSSQQDPPDTSPNPPAEDLPRALPISCWRPPGSLCDPRDGEGCNVGAGETCDIAQTVEGDLNLICLPGPNPQGLDESCNPSSGPFCSAGLNCVEPGVCKQFCCSDSDCSGGLSCRAFSAQVGSLGVCEDGGDAPDQCAPPGGFCRTNPDCCSNNCHNGHCH